VLDKAKRTTAVRITDGDQVIYDEISQQDTDYDINTLAEKQISLVFYGREWLLDVRAGLDFRADNSGFESFALLIAGLLIDIGLLALFVALKRQRASAK